jgi:serine/threonine protein kinase
MHVHAHGLIHAQLRPSNILFDADWEPRVVDLGVPRCVRPGYLCALARSDVEYIAPEIIDADPDAVFNRWDQAKVDAFAFGMILYEIITGLKPYAKCDILAIQRAIFEGERPSIPDADEYNELIVGICQHCWDPDPEERPEFWQIVVALYEYDEPPFTGADRAEYDAYMERIFRQTLHPSEAEELFSSLQPRGSPSNQGAVRN